MLPVEEALLQSLACLEISEADVVDDRNEGGFHVGQRRLVRKAELPDGPLELLHCLLEADTEILPALLQEEIRIAAEELQVGLEDAVTVHELVRLPTQTPIGLDSGCFAHLPQQLMGEIEHPLSVRSGDQRGLVLRESTPVGSIERIADTEPQNFRARQMQA